MTSSEVYIKVFSTLLIMLFSIILIGLILKTLRDHLKKSNNIISNDTSFFSIKNFSRYFNKQTSNTESIVVDEVKEIANASLVKFTCSGIQYLCVLGKDYGFVIDKKNTESK